LLFKSEKTIAAISSNDKLISMIGDKSHKLYQQALGQSIPYNQELLELLLTESEQRELKNKVIDWAISTYNEYKNGTLYIDNDIGNDNISYDQDGFDKFYKITQNRKSIRKFQQAKIPREVIDDLLRAAIEAPSSCNRQSWRFAIFEKSEDKIFISKLRNVAFIEKAPILLCVFVDVSVYRNKNEAEITSIMDASAAIMNILNAAAAANLGGVWINLHASMNNEQVSLFKNKFNFPDHYMPISFIALGGIALNTRKPERYDLEKYCINVE